MKRELTLNEIIYNIEYGNESRNVNYVDIKEMINPYKEIKRALKIKRSGYNLYVIDSFSNDKIDGLVDLVRNEYKSLKPPSDICYATLEDSKKPFPIFLTSGKGNLLKKGVKKLKEDYTVSFLDFLNASSDDEKDNIIEEVHLQRNKYIGELVEMSKNEGFDVKATGGGFAFIPLNEGEIMTEKEYDCLEREERGEILQKANKLKKRAEVILEDLKDLELNSVEKLKCILKKYLEENMEDTKDDLLLEFIADDDAYNYLEKLYLNIENDLMENYNIDIEDEEVKIEEVLSKYDIEVLIDNSKREYPPVIYEDDPNIINLLGNIEYESQNGNYITDLSLINPGSLLKANGGCLIIRLSRLISNVNSYYYLKKALISGKVSFDSNKNYIELVSINGLKPEAIPIDVKVILIGDYESYNILYSNDEEFKRLFPLKCEVKEEIRKSNDVYKLMREFILKKIEEMKLLNVEEDGIKSIIRFLVREVSNREKISVDYNRIENILVKADIIAKENNSNIITNKDIDNILYKEEDIENEYLDMYKDKKIFINTEGKIIGNINGLAVLDTGTYRFGKPLRITCVAIKGSGEVIDIHKEAKLSGKIHEKSIKILQSLLNSKISKYNSLPIDLHLSFEQSYGMIEGDSASVAEMVVMLSAISQKGIKQNIAVTGSLNQFGEVQPIGGVNEKIEGFFNVCKTVGSYKGKGVLIPDTNKDELILKPEIEDAVKKGDFHIYVMSNLEDAIETLILDDDENIEDFYSLIQEELKKYKD
ncbi:AAA family ATPase [Clostridium baratii]|uniref:endopeptidase La n=1 Tax=Clostridium baratii TaxID=1561 RepID=A0A174PQI6_9CLOT|nr:AAA family ATPase [Clostridium baratii]CUP60169.1 putative ATP-dependent protease [Clostridium baratii]